MIQIKSEGEALVFRVKVTPGASKTRYLGEREGMARIAVAAAPEKGKANAALVDFLAKLLDVRKCDIAVVTGKTGPLKTIRIERVTADALRAALQPARY